MSGFSVSASPIETVGHVQQRPLGGLSKRSMDVLIAAAALIALSPLMLALILIIKMSDGGPAFFGHTRIGFGRRRFRCWKFRSMVVDGPAVLAAHLASDASALAEWNASQKLKKDPRVTALGAFLRATSLDELPQFWNVLVGEMSLVGPRPIVDEEVFRYGGAISHYLAVRPGVTGSWQISGRSNTTYRRRVALDRHYATRWTLSRDVVILVRTVPAVLKQRGSA